MAAAVMAPLQSLSLDNGIMAPSPLSPNSSRHGRRSSVAKGNKTRGRGYSIVDERDTLISKALTWVLKRTISEDSEQEEDSDKLVADAEGWVSADEVLSRTQLTTLEVTFPELQSLIASPSSKSKFALRPKDSATPETLDLPSSYLIRTSPSVVAEPKSTAAPTVFTPLTPTSEDLPELILYETSYPNYPLILASGTLKRAGGQAHLSFTSSPSTLPSPSADVSIFVNLPSIMASYPKITWARTETGSIVTAAEVPKEAWLKVVAKRGDIGVLYEEGEVRKEIPVGLRGKGAKAKKGRGMGKVAKGAKEVKSRSEDEGTNSE